LFLVVSIILTVFANHIYFDCLSPLPKFNSFLLLKDLCWSVTVSKFLHRRPLLKIWAPISSGQAIENDFRVTTAAKAAEKQHLPSQNRRNLSKILWTSAGQSARTLPAKKDYVEHMYSMAEWTSSPSFSSTAKLMRLTRAHRFQFADTNSPVCPLPFSPFLPIVLLAKGIGPKSVNHPTQPNMTFEVIFMGKLLMLPEIRRRYFLRPLRMSCLYPVCETHAILASETKDEHTKLPNTHTHTHTAG